MPVGTECRIWGCKPTCGLPFPENASLHVRAGQGRDPTTVVKLSDLPPILMPDAEAGTLTGRLHNMANWQSEPGPDRGLRGPQPV